MFKSMLKDVSGSADICTVVTSFSKLQATAFVLPGETILFAFQSSREEFVFTNEALLLVVGESATTTRKLVTRLEYRDHTLSRVQFETTGRVDRDCEIKFQIGEHAVSIDIAKKEEEFVKTHYKTLVALAREQQEHARRWDLAKTGLDRAADALKLTNLTHAPVTSLATQATSALQWLEDDFERFNPRDYNAVVQRALQVNAPSSSGRR